MKKLFIPLAILLAATPVFAASRDGAVRPEIYEYCRTANALPDFKNLDIDRDGMVNYREMRSSDEKQIGLFDKIDSNDDDYISPRELDAYAKVGNCREEQ